MGDAVRFPLFPVCTSRNTVSVATPAKLNLFLEIEGRRPDGFHDLLTLMIAVDWLDELSFEARSDTDRDRLRVTGLDVTAGEDNLVRRALEIVRRDHEVPALDITLRKRIPAGAGLGGGSGNAAGMLALLAHRFDLRDSVDVWRARAAELGSDVPFFLYDGVSVATGRGEKCEAFGSGFLGGDEPRFVIVVPPHHSDTAAAYRGLSLPLTSPDGPISFSRKAFQQSKEWVNSLFNRLESSVLGAHRELAGVASWLEESVAGRWRMTGSGSGFFVVCPDAGEASTLRDRLHAESRASESLPQPEAGDRRFPHIVVACRYTGSR